MTINGTTQLASPELRGRFPGLSRKLDGRTVAFLDGPGGSQVPDTVIEAVTTYLSDANANLEAPFATSVETTEIYAEARRAAADFTGSAPDEIAFGANMTTLNYLLAHAVGRTLEEGDEIVTTDLDHEANVSPWLQIADDHKLLVRTVPFDDEGALDLDVLASALCDRTRIVAFPLAANSLGTKTPARQIADMAHEVGALAWADGVHIAPHDRLDREGLGLDVVLCSPYKFFGPHLGLAAISRPLAESLPADRVRPAGSIPPGHRFETGTQNHEAIAGFVAAVEYLAGLGEGTTRRERLDSAFSRISAYEASLSTRALERLSAIPSLKLYGLRDPDRVGERTPTFSFSVEGWDPAEVSARLAAEGIYVWDGNLYALNASLALGLEEQGGFVRAGFLHYSTLEEVDRFCDAVERLSS